MQANDLLLALEKNLADGHLVDEQQEQLLGQLRVLCRDHHSAAPIFDEKGLSVLATYGLDRPAGPVSHEALRCLSNAFVLSEKAKQTFIELRYAGKLTQRLRGDDVHDEFLCSRLIFLLTYSRRLDYDALLDQYGLADSITRHLERHADRLLSPQHPDITSDETRESAMAETLKLMFNVTYFCPASIPKFTPAIEPIINIMLRYPLRSPPLQSPLNWMLNALMNTDLHAAQIPQLTTASTAEAGALRNPRPFITRIATILERSLAEQAEKELDQAAAPLCTLIRRLYESAPPDVRQSIQQALLPSDVDRERPLGQSQTLPSRLLRASTSANLPTLRENISSLLFELSDKDATKFIHNVGYGYASGFLMSHNIKIPLDVGELKAQDRNLNTNTVVVNPITGQKVVAEERDRQRVDEMTPEEKEREAERLFVLFERLKATGVVDVQNPVESAIREGRFEEVE